MTSKLKKVTLAYDCSDILIETFTREIAESRENRITLLGIDFEKCESKGTYIHTYVYILLYILTV